MQRLDLQAQTLYAELLQRVLSDVIAAPMEKLGRAFVSKKIGRRTYWYLQHRQSTGMKQTYLGPETPDLLQVIESSRAAGKALEPDIARRKELCAAIRAMGFPNWPKPFVSTLETLANSGVFHLGAILIGTPAYVTCVNTLGFRSEIGTALTGDIDLQIDPAPQSIMPGAAAINVGSVLERVKLGFFPVAGLDPRSPTTTFKVRDGDLMVQFLTADSGGGGKSIYMEQLGTAAQPMPYMEYLTPEPMKAVLPFEAGILVNIPNPARFCWHKLIVASNRPQHERAKARKDVEQAADLIEALAQSDLDSLQDAFADAHGRGASWVARLESGIARLKNQRFGAYETIRKIVGGTTPPAVSNV